MLRVTFEIVPFGFEDDKREIGKIKIGLQDTDKNGVSSYISEMETDGLQPPPNLRVALKHPTANGAFSLVEKALSLHLEPEVCQSCGHRATDIERRRLNTAYALEESNWMTSCLSCYEITVAHYEDLWNEYYLGR